MIAAEQPMAQDSQGFEDRFTPLRPASGLKLTLALIFGPIAWLIALSVVSALLKRSDMIQFGLVVTLASFVVAFVVLIVLRAGRRREERRYADRA
jgi:hypothetical protein